jgi:phage shock protein A
VQESRSLALLQEVELQRDALALRLAQMETHLAQMETQQEYIKYAAMTAKKSQKSSMW